jgi:hypothetical protein
VGDDVLDVEVVGVVLAAEGHDGANEMAVSRAMEQVLEKRLA